MSKAGQHLDGVRFELLARAAAVAELPPPQVGIDCSAVEAKPGRQPREHGHECWTVRFTCGDEAERHAATLDAEPIVWIKVLSSRHAATDVRPEPPPGARTDAHAAVRGNSAEDIGETTVARQVSVVLAPDAATSRADPVGLGLSPG